MVFVSKISYFCVLPACVFFKVSYAYKFIRARVLYAQNLYARARILRICSCILYVLLREGGEWILSIRPGRGGHGPRRNLGGSDAQADRPSRLPSVFFFSDLPHGSEGDTGLERRRRE